MTYIDNETGADTAKPVELYRFTGTFNIYRMTSFGIPITSNGELFGLATVSRNKLNVGTQENGGERALEITLPFDHPLIREYAYESSPPDLTLELIRAHRQDFDDTVLLWSGKVTGVSVTGRTAKLRVPATFSYILEGNTPTPRFQGPCNHVLYSPACGADPALHQHVTTVDSLSGLDLNVADLPWVDNEGTAGILIGPEGESRMIISNVGTAVQVSYPFSGLAAGDSITLRKGCDHAFQGNCINRFNNGDRFGGFPLVPDTNPFTSSLI
tara:strand:+ start:21684 stop:22493 length:810 start_codon:yes stop_codon:yes gene_type:complete